MSRRRLFQVLVATVVSVCLLVLAGVLSAQGNSDNALEHAKQVQERHTNALMAVAGVVGTAISEDEDFQPIILVLLEHGAVGGIPQNLEGVPVRAVVTGKIEALNARGKGKPGSSVDPKSYFERPVPIGVSTGNATAENWATGTIGCRVTKGGHVYALSNNHVYALENSAEIGSAVLQPGLYDTQGHWDSTYIIGELTDFAEIVSTDNTVDAAIAEILPMDNGQPRVDNATPSNGYGIPSSTTVEAALTMRVQKYGRTTSLTRGAIVGINATLDVGYSFGTARFVSQIIVYSQKGAFIKAGDSGSLLVTDPGKQPVGLLFAGDSSGKYGIANPIDAVLDEFGVSIDGE